MKYLVLGSDGQIGRPLVQYLRSLNHIVYTMDRNDDLRIPNSKLSSYLAEGIDLVYFLAFDVGGAKYLKKYQHTYEFINNNVLIMKEVFEQLKRYNTPFMFASSQMTDMDHSSYGALKIIGEYYTKSLDGMLIKFWNIYGKEEHSVKSHVITDFIHQAQTNKHIQLITDGQEKRQMLHVQDCCRCLEILSRNYNTIPRDKNLHITAFKWIKVLEIADIVASLVPTTTVTPSLSSDILQYSRMIEPDPFILSLWQPQIALVDGIKTML